MLRLLAFDSAAVLSWLQEGSSRSFQESSVAADVAGSEFGSESEGRGRKNKLHFLKINFVSFYFSFPPCWPILILFCFINSVLFRIFFFISFLKGIEGETDGRTMNGENKYYL